MKDKAPDWRVRAKQSLFERAVQRRLARLRQIQYAIRVEEEAQRRLLDAPK
jgi:hypothetical protein